MNQLCLTELYHHPQGDSVFRLTSYGSRQRDTHHPDGFGGEVFTRTNMVLVLDVDLGHWIRQQQVTCDP